MKKILQKVTIVQKNGDKQIFDAIFITELGIYTGVIKINNNGEENFQEHSFIPLDQIEKITIQDNQGINKNIDFKKN